MKTSQPNVAVWRGYRIRHAAAALMLVAGLPASAGAAIALKAAQLATSDIALITPMMVWAGLFGLAGFSLTRWPCPRCEKAFGGDRTCLSCGLTLFSALPFDQNTVAQASMPADQ